MKESELCRRIKRQLEAKGYFVWKQHGGPMQRAGLPDLFALKDGKLSAIEIKVPGQNLTKLQIATFKKLKAHNAFVAICTTIDRCVPLSAWLGKKACESITKKRKRN